MGVSGVARSTGADHDSPRQLVLDHAVGVGRRARGDVEAGVETLAVEAGVLGRTVAVRLTARVHRLGLWN